MANDYKTYVDNYRFDVEKAAADVNTAFQQLDDINITVWGISQKTTIVAIKTCLTDLINGVYHLLSHEISEPFFYNNYNALKANCDYLDKCGAAITWKTICEAWVKNDFEGKEWTIACIDRMRQLMWDKPFKIQWAANPTAEST